MTVIIAGTVTVKSEDHDAILEAALEMMTETRKEEGCFEYVLSADPQTRGLLRLYEKWESADNLKAHAASAHMAAWKVKGEEIGIIGRDIALYQISSETPL